LNTERNKAAESRVALRPAGAEMLAHDGHEVVIESGAGLGSGFSDDDYSRAGARIANAAADVWQQCELILKVKERCKVSTRNCALTRQFSLTSTSRPTKACTRRP
jgi:alanine dehydrogenase